MASITEKKNFSKEITELCRKHKMDIVEAIIHYCQKRNIELETIIPFINTSMKDRIRKYGVSLHMIKKRRKK